MGVGPHKFRRPFGPIGEAHFEALGALHDVIVGQDMAMRIKNDARAGGVGRSWIEEKIVGNGAARDVDHAGIEAAVDIDVIFFVRG